MQLFPCAALVLVCAVVISAAPTDSFDAVQPLKLGALLSGRQTSDNRADVLITECPEGTTVCGANKCCYSQSGTDLSGMKAFEPFKTVQRVSYRSSNDGHLKGDGNCCLNLVMQVICCSGILSACTPFGCM